MTNFKAYKLGEILLDVAMGPFGSNLKTDNFIPSGVPVIRGGNLNEGGFDDKHFVFVSEKKAQSLKRSLAYPDDLVFTHRGTIGQVGIIENTKYPYYLVSQSQMRLTVNKNYLSPRYLYYWFKSAIGQYELLKNSAQVGVPSIASPTKSLKEVDINLPEIQTQIAIADILTALDEKIQINHKINSELEILAQALFKQWFIDFEFPNEDGLPYKNSGGEMVESELGEIPEGWNVISFKESVEKYIDNRGKTPPTISCGIPLVEVRNMSDKSIYPTLETQKFVSEEVYQTWFRAYLEPDDILMSTVGTIGRLNITPKNKLFAIAQNVLGIRFKKTILTQIYMFCLMRSKLFNDEINSRLIITVQASIKRSDIEKIPILIPNNELLKKFSNMVDPYFSEISNLSDEILQLTQLRDILIPKLISGELVVTNTN